MATAATIRKAAAQNAKRHSDQKLPPKPFTEYLAENVEEFKVQHRSVFTLYSYARNMRFFFAWCECRGIVDVREITLNTLERYQKHLFYYRKPLIRPKHNKITPEDASDGSSQGEGEPLKVVTQIQRLVACRNFFSWLTKAKYISANPASEITLPRPPQRLPKDVLTHDEAPAGDS